MGCNVVCPYLPAKHIEDWGLEDPTGKCDEEFINTSKIIESKIKDATGVDLNEELVDLVKYQSAYKAAAQVFNTCNSCLDILMSLGG